MHRKSVLLALLLLVALLLGGCSLLPEDPDNFSYSVNSDNSAVINGYVGSRREIVIPAIIHGHKVVGVDEGAFDGNEELTSIVLPQYLTSIGDNAFSGCTKLARIEFPASLRTIGSKSFYDCESLTEVVLPEGLESIGGNGFWFCTNLTSIQLPDSLREIGGAAFANCQSLESIRLPARLTEVGWKLFSSCGRLKQVTFPKGLKIIQEEAFSGCSALRELTLPQGLEKIGCGAFSNCIYLEKINIPASVKEMYVEAYTTRMDNPMNPFQSCYSLKTIELDPANRIYFQRDGALIRRSDMTLIDYQPTDTAQGYVIPEGVRTIGGGAIRTLKGAQPQLTIPSSVTSIGKYAIHINNLTELVIPTSVKKLDDMAIWLCDELRSVTIPASVTTLTSEAIRSCTALESIIVDRGSRAARVFADDPRLVIRN